MTAYRHITHENYEGWFLLYVDNELSIEQQQQVKQFVTSNPHLAAELAALQAAVNHPGEKISFKNKDRLCKNIDDGLTDEELILFFDGEADVTLSERITKSNSQQLQQRLALLRKTFSIADASIFYSKKEKLYRRGKTIPMRTWLLRVAAAVIIAAVGIWLFSNTSFTPKDQADRVARQTASIPDKQTASAVAVDPEQNDNAIVEEQVMNTDINPPVTMPQPVRKNTVDPALQQTIMAEENTSRIAVTSESEPAQLPAGVVKRTIETDTELTAAIALEEPVQKEAIIVTASTPEPQKKLNRFFKNVSEKIKETAIDVLSDDNENIIVAGLAINVRK